MPEYIFLRIAAMSASGSIALLLLMLLKPLTKRIFSPRWNYYSLVLTMLVFLLPLSVKLPQNADSTPAQTQVSTADEQKNEATVMFVIDAIDAKTQEHKIIEKQQPTVLYNYPNLAEHLCKTWLICASFLLLTRLSFYFIFKTKINRASVPYPLDEVTQILLSVKKCSLVKSPILAGLVRPVLYLPDRNFTQTEIDSILRHEYVHLRRMDILVKWLCLVVKSLHWFNPSVYVLCKKINIECEISCDVEATRNLDRDKVAGYCETILSIISDKNNKISLALGMGDTKKNLERRFRAIMTDNEKSKKIAVISAIFTGIVVLSALTVSAILGGKAEKNNNNTDKKEEIEINENGQDFAEREYKNEITGGEADAFKADYNDEPVIIYHVIENENQDKNSINKAEDKEAENDLIPLEESADATIQIQTTADAEISYGFDKENHPAVDYKLDEGTVITSPLNGTVKVAEYAPDKGNHIEIEGDDGTTRIVYAHLEKMYIKKGEKVNAGDTVGTVGSTGRATGPHLHLEYYENGEALNPVEVFITEENGEILAVYSKPEQIID